MTTARQVLGERDVAIRRTSNAAYPSEPPFHPSVSYPEYAGPVASAPNEVYEAVRQVLADLGLDRDRVGRSDWNPIGALVPAGAKIVIKPNWVLHRNERPGGGTDELISHASVLRALLDYAWLARPREIVVGDAPIQVCDFHALQRLGFSAVADYFAASGRAIRVKDFRRTVMVREATRARVAEDLVPLDEFVEVDIGRDSLLEPISADAERFRVTMYDPRKMIRNHAPGVHKYLIAGDVLDADLVINVPKLKTHKKAGVTLALKNLVGINGNKDYLPHHRKGAADRGGDNYERSSIPKRLAENLLDLANRHLDKPRLYRRGTLLIYKLLFFDRIRGKSTDIEGGWHGNDTVWRMCLDLNKVLLYADRRGHLHETPQRMTLHVTDGIVAGEGDGPLCPSPVPFRTLTASLNPAAHDWVVAEEMGYDPARIPICAHAFDGGARPITTIAPSEIRRSRSPESAADRFVFRAPPGWRGHVERA